MAITKDEFGRVENRDAALYTLTGEKIRAGITDFGGAVVSLETPDDQGRRADVVLGYDRLDDYIRGGCFFGAIVGRCANRIGGGEFEIDGQTHRLPRNDGGKHHLHGGARGFFARLWESRIEEKDGRECLVLELASPHLDENYPGELRVKAVYSVAEPGGLLLEMTAETDRPTIVNLTNHAYFNLSGHDSGTIHDHRLMIRADTVTEVDEELIPTGKTISVAGGPLDFRSFRPLGKAMTDGGEPYDHNFVLTDDTDDGSPAAALFDPASGRLLEIFSDKPGMQLYTGQYIMVGTKGKSGALYGPYSGLCLEPQVHPNAVNIPEFPSVILRPGELYRHTILFRFSVHSES